jgi:hypothetical protein
MVHIGIDYGDRHVGRTPQSVLQISAKIPHTQENPEIIENAVPPQDIPQLLNPPRTTVCDSNPWVPCGNEKLEQCFTRIIPQRLVRGHRLYLIPEEFPSETPHKQLVLVLFKLDRQFLQKGLDHFSIRPKAEADRFGLRSVAYVECLN